MGALMALWGTWANLTFPHTALSFSTVCSGDLRSLLLCFSASQLPQPEKRDNYFFSSGNKEQ